MRYLTFLLLFFIAACSPNAKVAHTGFAVDEFVAITLEYQGPRAVVGIDTYGPTKRAFKCGQTGAAAVSQSDGLIPKSHTMVATCLHVDFGGPLPKGAAVEIPVTGTPFEYVTIGVEYTKEGHFVGAQALHSSPDAKTCMREAHDVIDTNYENGQVAADNSLLLYCMPIPAIETDPKDEGGIV